MRRREFLSGMISATIWWLREPNETNAAPAKKATFKGPLRIHPKNPRYFTDDGKRVIYLTGSHTWTNLQDGFIGKTFDFNAYLDFLAEHNHNFIRMWSWQSTGAWVFPEIRPHPWERTGPGIARDGKPKFDLTKFNDAYFKRLRERVEAAAKRGIYVSVMFFVGGNFDVPDEWIKHPFHKDNNINSIDGDADGDGKGTDLVTLVNNPKVVAARKLLLAYIRRVIDTLNDLDNVLFEVINEGGTKEWDWFIARFVKDYEATKPKQHPIGLTGHGRESNDEMLASPADWFSPGSREWPDLRTDPRPVEASWRKVSILDTDHIWGEGGNAQWVWKSFTRGHNPIYMDRIAHLTGDTRGDIPNSVQVRKAMGMTRWLAEQVNLALMQPMPNLSSTMYCLANPGSEYVVYLPHGTEVTVDLTKAIGSLRVTWLHPVDGTKVDGGKVEGGARRTFKSPFSDHATLWLVKV
ncbi:MAG: DUF6298 domain-containing protein [Armatimonadota bacterium]